MADDDIAVVAAAWYLLEKKTKTRIQRQANDRTKEDARGDTGYTVLWGGDKNWVNITV